MILSDLTTQTSLSKWIPLTLAAVLLLVGIWLAVGQWTLPLDDPALVESTPGQLSLWVAGQTADSRPESPLAIMAKWTGADGVLSEEAALARARAVLGLLALVAVGLTVVTLSHLYRQSGRSRIVTIWLLLSYIALLLNVAVEGERPYSSLTLAGLALCLIILIFAPGHFSDIYGFLIVIASILVFWELYKALGAATGNSLPLTDFPWKLPHWQNIAEQLLQPARRNGPFLLIRILGEAAFITWLEAITGFIVGSLLGFGLGTLFAHSPLLERGLLPYVVASQTVPIIAIAPMIVAFLGQGWLPVAVISAYLTFFPVTVNTLRGLLSPPPLKLELMHSYAASRADILWKLRVPSALPYIFTALKVSATASVVGAIVGELPSSRSDGLAAAILRASGNYAAEPEKLWAAIIMATLVGIAFFTIVSLVERRVLRGMMA